jgi:hypothetical protein
VFDIARRACDAASTRKLGVNLLHQFEPAHSRSKPGTNRTTLKTDTRATRCPSDKAESLMAGWSQDQKEAEQPCAANHSLHARLLSSSVEWSQRTMAEPR